MEWLGDPQIWIALLTLITLEIVLGIDNVIFIVILAEKLPESQRKRARTLGLLVAMVTRVGLLFTLSWIMGLTQTLFEIWGEGFSGRDLILIGGGLFLLAKSTSEIHHKVEGASTNDTVSQKVVSFASVIMQIVLLDIVFSLDSIITAIGLANRLWVMVVAIVAAVIVMMVAAEGISNFVSRHPTVKVLALSFLLLIGLTLIAEGFDLHIPKGYIYFAMLFSALVEAINVKIRSPKKDSGV